MQVQELALPGVLLFKLDVFGDSRGLFFESYNRRRYAEAGLEVDFVQDNVSLSQRGILRGLHYQIERPQGKLVHVPLGAVVDVMVDLRRQSPTFGKSLAVRLDDVARDQLYVPPGLAHGFQVVSEKALFAYKCTDFYHAASERSLLWSDPALKIEWPIAEPILSGKDAAGVPLAKADVFETLGA